MTSKQIVDEISRLPLSEKMSILEIVLEDINSKSENDRALAEGARALVEDYTNDNELIAFTALDSENFYETK